MKGSFRRGRSGGTDESATVEEPSALFDEAWRQLRSFPAEGTIPLPSEELQARVGPAPAFHDVALTTMGRMNMAGLRPDHDVLDVGCGVGRTARYLCDYLDPSARYEGFDIMEEMIEWCQENITPRFPNFRFTHVSLFHVSYKPDESLPSAATFRFPYDDESFDFVFAHSVFTHLHPESSDNYLHELHRVLRPGGIAYTTWFLFQEDVVSSPKAMVTEMTMDPSGLFAVHDPDVPDNAIAYRESFVLEKLRENQLSLVAPIHPGFARMQDVVVAVKES